MLYETTQNAGEFTYFVSYRRGISKCSRCQSYNNPTTATVVSENGD